MAVKKGNTTLTLSIDPDKAKEFKEKAKKAGMTLSSFMTQAASSVDPYVVFKHKEDK